MSRKPSLTLALVALAVSVVWMTARPSGQSAGLPSTRNGEWPAYAADIRGTRYSPLDQINGSNFNKLEVAWRFKTDNLGTRPEYKLEGTPLMVKGVLYTTAGTRRSVVALDARTGEVIWTHSYREGQRAAIAPRQLSGRGVAYWTDGKGDDRVIYVTTGYRLIELNAKNGAMIGAFGKDGIVDLKTGMVIGKGQQIDLETGEVGLHSTPTVAKDVIIVGSSFKEGMTVKTHNNTKGLVRAFDARTGKLLWTFNTMPRPGESGHETWENESWAINGNTGVWTGITVDEDLGLVYLPVEITDVGFLRWPSSRQQPVRREPGLRRPEDRPHEVALPDRASPDLGLRPLVAADPRRHHGERQADQGRGAAEQGGVPVRLRPRDRAAGLADRGAPGSTERHPRREDVADAAVPDQTAGVRTTGSHGERADRFHPGAPAAGARAVEILPDGPDVPAAGRQQDWRSATPP